MFKWPNEDRVDGGGAMFDLAVWHLVMRPFRQTSSPALACGRARSGWGMGRSGSGGEAADEAVGGFVAELDGVFADDLAVLAIAGGGQGFKVEGAALEWHDVDA